MSNVFVVDTNKHQLNPVHPGRARLLLTQGKAAVFKRFPFTIILKGALEHPEIQPLRIKIDPGSKTTGIALVNDATGEVVFAAELTHRGQAIKDALDDRRTVRRGRRNRSTRYRQPRFLNRRRAKGWLAPSLESRITNILTWVHRLRDIAPITEISQELVRFDLQKMEHPEISGVEYQQGTLMGYEVREYLLEKWHRKCAYCGKENVPLQVEHIRPRAKDGSHRISNLCIACRPCNEKKGTQDIQVFLADKPELLKRILAQAKASLKDAAAVNSTRWALYERLQRVGLPVEVGSGGLTKFNRSTRHLEKTHWLDAACIGKRTPEVLKVQEIVPLQIKANGHGNRQMCGVDKRGFPIRHRQRRKRHFGFQTGDMIRAVVTKGVHRGTYIGRVAIKADGYFKITGGHGMVEGIHARYCSPIHCIDGYSYQQGERGHSSPA